MSRFLSPAILDAVSANAVYLALLFEAEFFPQPVRLWTGMGSLSVDGRTYLGATVETADGKRAMLVNVSVDQASDATAASATFTLTNVPPEAAAADLNNAVYRNRPLTVWLACFDEFGALIGSPFRLWKGLMDMLSASFGPDGVTMTLTAESRSKAARKNTESMWSDAAARKVDSLDGGFRYLSVIQQRDYPWAQRASNA